MFKDDPGLRALKNKVDSNENEIQDLEKRISSKKATKITVVQTVAIILLVVGLVVLVVAAKLWYIGASCFLIGLGILIYFPLKIEQPETEIPGKIKALKKEQEGLQAKIQLIQKNQNIYTVISELASRNNPILVRSYLDQSLFEKEANILFKYGYRVKTVSGGGKSFDGRSAAGGMLVAGAIGALLQARRKTQLLLFMKKKLQLVSPEWTFITTNIWHGSATWCKPTESPFLNVF